jgi:hypothetical protein
LYFKPHHGGHLATLPLERDERYTDILIIVISSIGNWLLAALAYLRAAAIPWAVLFTVLLENSDPIRR